MKYYYYNKAKNFEQSYKNSEQLAEHLRDILKNGFKYKFNKVKIELPCTTEYKHTSNHFYLETDVLCALLSYIEEKAKRTKQEFQKLVIGGNKMAQYIKEKVKVLKQFRVHITDEALQHMRGLKTEIAIDNYARSLILHSLGENFQRGYISRY